MSPEPKAYRKDGKIIVEMPEKNLIYATENSPNYAAKVVDKEAFLNHVTEHILEYTEGTDDDASFFRLFDNIALDMLENGDESIELVDADE